MRKTALFFGIFSMIALVSCKKKEETPMSTPTETSSETTITEAAAVSGEAKDSTSIKVSTDGVNVTPKDGASKITINVSGGEAKIEIRK